MNTTDTRFDRLAAVTQEAVDALKQAIERAEAAELQLSREAMQVAELMLEVRTLRKQRDEFRDEVEQLKRELSKAWYNRYRTPKIEVVQTEKATSRLHDEVIELRRHLGKTMSERDSNKELYDSWYRKHLRKLEAVKAERDALQARIDAGVRVWRSDRYGWGTMESLDKTHTALLIDPQPADHIADAGKMVDDDRKNDTDRRFGFARGSCWRINQTDDTRGKYRTAVPNTRRCTPGTKADRKPSWTRADGSATPRKGERRKGLEKCFTNPERGIEFWMDEVNLLHDEQRDPSGANDRRRNK